MSKFKYYYEFETLLGERPSNAPPFPNSTEEDLDTQDLFFGHENSDFEQEIDDEEGLEDNSRSSAKRPLSVSASLSQTRPGKAVRRGIESLLADALNKQHELGLRRLEIDNMNAISQKAQAQAMLIPAWKSLGLSNEEIISKLSEM